MDLKDYIRSIPDYPKKGILFRDITTLIKDEKAFKETIDKIIERSKRFKIDKIAAIESRGFVFASAVSYLLDKPFIMLRKKNKLPADVHSVDFELEYGTATIEVHKDSIQKNENVLVIDDLGATRMSEWETSVLDTLIANRYNSKKHTIFSSNLAFLDSNLYKVTSKDQVLDYKIGERNISRIFEMCSVLEMKGKDYRKKNRIKK